MDEKTTEEEWFYEAMAGNSIKTRQLLRQQFVCCVCVGGGAGRISTLGDLLVTRPRACMTEETWEKVQRRREQCEKAEELLRGFYGPRYQWMEGSRQWKADAEAFI